MYLRADKTHDTRVAADVWPPQGSFAEQLDLLKSGLLAAVTAKTEMPCSNKLKSGFRVWETIGGPRLKKRKQSDTMLALARLACSSSLFYEADAA